MDVLRQDDKTVNPTRKTDPKLSRPIFRLKMPASVTSVTSVTYEPRRCPRKVVPSTRPAFVHTVVTILVEVLEVRLRPSFTTWYLYPASAHALPQGELKRASVRGATELRPTCTYLSRSPAGRETYMLTKPYMHVVSARPSA